MLSKGGVHEETTPKAVTSFAKKEMMLFADEAY